MASALALAFVQNFIQNAAVPAFLCGLRDLLLNKNEVEQEDAEVAEKAGPEQFWTKFWSKTA